MGKVMLGLVLGFLAGWGISAWLELDSGDDRPRRRPSVGKGASRDALPPVDAARTEQGAREDAAAGNETPPDPREVLRTGAWRAVRALAQADEDHDTAGWVAVIGPRLADARAARDWRLYRALLEAAARAGTPDAHALLLDVVRDETLRFPQRMGRFFHEALADADLPGIAAAGRARIEHNVAAGATSWVGIDGWADLVAAHGAREDVEWLNDLDVSSQFASHAREALARSPNPHAIALARPRLAAGLGVRGATVDRWGEGLFGEFAPHHPREALALIEEERARRPDLTLGSDQVVPLAASVPSSELARVHGILAQPRDLAERIAFCHGVQALDRAGLDHAPLDFLLDAPVELLERVATGQAGERERALASRARYAIEYNPVLWSERAAAALAAAGYDEEAAKVAAGLNTEWGPG